VEGKQSQHRQHFNLSEAAKQMLEELTAQRYPGKQRRQSQLVEDLITEAFMKERNANTLVASSLEAETTRFALPTSEITRITQQRGSYVEGDPFSQSASFPRMIAESRTGYIATQDTIQTSLCPSCQREMQPGWKHCVYCGAALARRCSKCGTPQAEVAGACFCFECGSPLE